MSAVKNALAAPPPKRVNRLARALVVLPLRILGWLTLAWLALALTLAGSDFGQRELEGELSKRLGALGSSVDIDGVHVDWLGPGLRIDGLRVHNQGHEHLFLERVYVGASLSLDGGLRLSHVDVDQGRLLIAEQAIADVRALLDGESGELDASGPLDLPSVHVRGLQVDFQDPGGAEHRLGVLDFSMLGERNAPSRIGGRFVLPKTPQAANATEIFIAGLVSPAGLLELNTISDEVRLEEWDFPAIEPFEALRKLTPRGRVTLFTRGSVYLRGELEPRGELSFRVRDGALRVPGLEHDVSDLQFEFTSSFEPEVAQDFWTPRAWQGSGRLSATWAEQTLQAGLRIGADARPGLAFESWIHAPGLHVDAEALKALEGPELLRTLYSSVDPRGHANASVGITCDDTITPGESLLPKLEVTVRVENEGPLRGAYHGWPNPFRPGVEPMGFPMEAVCDDVLVVFARTRRFPRRNRLDVRWDGGHATGPVDGLYQAWSNPVDMPPFARGYGKDETDLLIRVPSLALDEDVERHLPELWEIPELANLYDDFGLEGGVASATVHISGRSELMIPAVRVDVEVRDVSAAYHLFPLRTTGLAGSVTVLEGGYHQSSVAYEFVGELTSARRLGIAGRLRMEQVSPESPLRAPRIDVLRLDVEGLDLKGEDIARLGETVPELREALDGYGATGRASVALSRQSIDAGDFRTSIEVATEGGDVTLLPKVFPVQASDVRGRVLIELTESRPITAAKAGADETPTPTPPRAVTRIAPLLGRWPGRVPVSLSATFGSESEGRVLGAAVSPANRELLGQVLVALGQDPESWFSDLEQVDLQGATDFSYTFRGDPNGAVDEVEQTYAFRLRENRLDQQIGVDLERLRGTLRLSEGALTGDEIDAQIGETPIQLLDLRAERVGDALVAEADLVARGIPLRGPLLGQMLEEESAELLSEEFGLRGTIDVERGHVRVKATDDGEPELVFSGEATVSDAFVAIGAPVSIRSARVHLEELRVQGDEVRGWGRIEDLYGQAVGRDLEQAELWLSYHGTQLTLETLNSQFCRGRLTGIGEDGTGRAPGPAFSVELRSPYRFQVGLSLEDIEVRQLLEGVFASDIADRGYLDAQFSLRGELENLLDIEGSGYAAVSETVLWSVPVVRDLFSQLGFDETAIFDEMESAFRIADGAVAMEGIYVHSPLLSLRGAGLLRFDGTLRHDLEVRYSLVDKFGPFSSLVYWLQNTLLAISIRGDMSRPKVVTRGVFSNPFRGVDDDWRALPYPGFSTLPSRF